MTLPINKMIDDVVKPCAIPENIKEGDVYATHEGVMKFGDAEMRVYVLNDGRRIINSEDMERFFGLAND